MGGGLKAASLMHSTISLSVSPLHPTRHAPPCSTQVRDVVLDTTGLFFLYDIDGGLQLEVH